MAFEDIDWGKVLTNVGQGVLTAAPGIIANNRGAQIVQQGNIDAARIAGQSAGRNISTITNAGTQALNQITAGNDLARQEIIAGNAGARAPLEAQAASGGSMAAPGVAYLRNLVASDPYQLTPAQKIALADSLRMSKNNIDPAMRGSGRAQTAVLNDVVNRGRAGMIDANIARGTGAAGTLASLGTGTRNSATTALANLSAGQGRDLGNLAAGQGRSAAALTTDTAKTVANLGANADEATANALTGNANVKAGSLGDIASMFASGIKDATRESRYQDFNRRGRDLSRPIV